MISVNYDEAQGTGGLVPVGEYEVVIKRGSQMATPGGTEYLNIPMVIRNDVEQPRQNAYLWHTVWHLKSPSASDPNGFSGKSIQIISKAANIPNGKSFSTLEEWLESLVGRVVRVTVEHDTYNGNTNARIKYTNESTKPECLHKFKEKPDTTHEAYTEVTSEDDSDLPF